MTDDGDYVGPELPDGVVIADRYRCIQCYTDYQIALASGQPLPTDPFDFNRADTIQHIIDTTPEGSGYSHPMSPMYVAYREEQ